MSDDTSDIVARVTRGWAEGSPDVLLGIACKEIEELRKQRDEARGLYLKRNYRGERLERELADAQKERDEARELYCVEAAHRSVCLRSVTDAKTIAKNRGWEGLFNVSEPVSPKTFAPIHREPAPTPAPPPKKCCKEGGGA